MKTLYKESTSSAPQAPRSNPPLVARTVAQRLSVVQWLAVAVVTLFVSTVLLFVQQPWRRVNSFPGGGRSWWLEPLEWNAVRGFPQIIGELNAVALQPKSARVWIAGDVGLLAYSDDSGDSWTKLEYDTASGSFDRAGLKDDGSPQSSLFNIVATVEAAAIEPQSVAIPPTGPAAQPSQSKSTSLPDPNNGVLDRTQKNSTIVPELLGQLLDDAKLSLGKAQLQIGKVVMKDDPSGRQIGRILAESPIAASRVPIGTSVNLVVGKVNGKPPTQNGKTSEQGSNPAIKPASGAPAFSATSKSKRTASSKNFPPPSLITLGFQPDGGTACATDARAFYTAPGTSEKWLPKGPCLVPLFPTKSKIFPNHYDLISTLTEAEHREDLPANEEQPGFTARSVWFSRPMVGCSVGYDQTSGDGEVQCTNDSKTWITAQRTGKDHLEDITFADAGDVGWAVGANGVILWTPDGGTHWQAKTQSAAIDMGALNLGANWWRWLPPWFYASWFFGLCCAVVAPLARIQAAPIKFIQDYAASDRPLEPGDRDALDFGPLAKSLSAFVRNAATQAPLTISIDGPWGSGKSSLMNLMCDDLREFGFRAIWFNAWHNQKEEYLLAALLQTVRLEAVPQLWDPSGFGFRIRLVIERLKRYWFPMMLITGLGVLLFCLDFFHSHRPGGHSLLLDIPKILPSWLGGSAKDAGGLFAQLNHWPSLGTFLALVAIWPVVRKLLEAFGTNPASLLATISKGNRMSDLDAQTSFRDKFAKEFRDVTRALGEDHQLVVFIDDLDRCRPENVRDVLEAVNFLVSSGECFVVMGLERSAVEAAVGLSLKDIAAEMLPNIDPADAAAARRKYACNFLDKLINLEVPIPLLDPNKARGLFYEETPDSGADGSSLAELLHRRVRAKRAERWVRYADVGFRFLLGFAVSTAMLIAAYQAGAWLDQFARSKLSTAPSIAASVLNGDKSVPASAPLGGDQFGAQTLSPAQSRPTVLPKIYPGSSPRPEPWNLSWPELAAVAILSTIAYYALVAVGKGARHDSKKFIDALAIWYPLVIARQATPRAVKRWMNRVRYLATRELPASELRSPIERVADWYARRDEKSDSRAVQVLNKEHDETLRIPEEIVVTLAAIQEFDPRLLRTAANVDALQNKDRSAGLSTMGATADALIAAKRRSYLEAEGFTGWDQISRHVPRFLALWPTIDIQ